MYWHSLPALIGKGDVKKFPVIGTVSTALETVYIDRQGGSDSKKDAVIRLNI